MMPPLFTGHTIPAQLNNYLVFWMLPSDMKNIVDQSSARLVRSTASVY